jgi:hypothetical protein
MPEPRKGYEWVACSDGTGFWQKTTGPAHLHKLDFFCPHCRRITSTLDDDCLLEYGFCKTCYVMHVEDRKTPTIDLTKYKKN